MPTVCFFKALESETWIGPSPGSRNILILIIKVEKLQKPFNLD